MAINTTKKTSSENCPKCSFHRFFQSFSVIVFVVCLSFICGYFTNSVRRGNRHEKVSKTNSFNEVSRRRRLASDFRLQLLNSLKAKNLEENLRYLSQEPHFASSKRNNDLADDIAAKWLSYGFDEVEMAKYDVLMNYPYKNSKRNKVEIRRNSKVIFTSKPNEKVLRKDEEKAKEFPVFLGYASSGRVKDEIVYANFGTEEDLRQLEDIGVSVKNKIVIIRIGKIFRGNKVFNAASHGASGAIIYTDPGQFAPDGPLNTFPNSWWLPDTGVQRGTSLGKQGPGDPLTPGFPSVDGIYRKPLNQSGLPTIPAMALSYGDAKEILRRMKGPKAPKEWQGGLDLTYHVGPGFTDKSLSLHMEVNSKSEIRTIYNVIGKIRGKEEPDRYVLMGNHRDAWVFGAADAVSGTSVLMEVSRGLGELLKSGWRPRRTIMLCSWDAEELFIVGSAEYVEENAQILQDRAVAYLNMDVVVNGNFSINVDANPLLQNLAISLTKEIRDPTVERSNRSMYDVMLERDVTKHINGSAFCENLPFGSDYVAFYQFIGVSCADWSYIFGGTHGIRRSYPVYHSLHDTFYWMKTFVDPEFKTHLAMGKYAAMFLFDLSESPMLPFNTTTYAKLIQSKAKEVEQNLHLKKHDINLMAFSHAIENFVNISHEFEANKSKLRIVAKDLRPVNDQMMLLEKAFIQTVEPNNPRQLRHVIYGPDLLNLYDGLYFPRLNHAIKMAITSGDWDQVQKEISLLTYSVNSATSVLKPI